MALNANALTLLATQKEHLEIPALDTTFDTKLERLINVASSYFEKYTRRKLVTDTYTDFVDGRASNRIMLKQWPIQSITSVNIDNSSIFGANTLIDASEYFIEENFGLVRVGGIEGSFGSLWTKGTRNIKVVYVAGLGTAAGGDLPPELEQACLDYVMWLDDMNTDRRIGRQTKSKGDESVSYVQDIPAHIALILDGYYREEFTTEAPVGVLNK